MADYAPIFTGRAAPYTMQASGAIVGGTPVMATTTAGSVATATADTPLCVGIAGHDAATGTKVTVIPIDGVTHEVAVVAAGTVTAGDGVTIGALSTVKTAPTSLAAAAAAGTLIGIAVTTATAPALVRFVGRQ